MKIIFSICRRRETEGLRLTAVIENVEADAGGVVAFNVRVAAEVVTRRRPNKIVGSGLCLDLGNAIVEGDGQIVGGRRLCGEGATTTAGSSRINIHAYRISFEIIPIFKREVASFVSV